MAKAFDYVLKRASTGLTPRASKSASIILFSLAFSSMGILLPPSHAFPFSKCGLSCYRKSVNRQVDRWGDAAEDAAIRAREAAEAEALRIRDEAARAAIRAREAAEAEALRIRDEAARAAIQAREAAEQEILRQRDKAKREYLRQRDEAAQMAKEAWLNQRDALVRQANEGWLRQRDEMVRNAKKEWLEMRDQALQPINEAWVKERNEIVNKTMYKLGLDGETVVFLFNSRDFLIDQMEGTIKVLRNGLPGIREEAASRVRACMNKGEIGCLKDIQTGGLSVGLAAACVYTGRIKLCEQAVKYGEIKPAACEKWSNQRAPQILFDLSSDPASSTPNPFAWTGSSQSTCTPSLSPNLVGNDSPVIGTTFVETLGQPKAYPNQPLPGYQSNSVSILPSPTSLENPDYVAERLRIEAQERRDQQLRDEKAAEIARRNQLQNQLIVSGADVLGKLIDRIFTRRQSPQQPPAKPVDPVQQIVNAPQPANNPYSGSSPQPANAPQPANTTVQASLPQTNSASAVSLSPYQVAIQEKLGLTIDSACGADSLVIKVVNGDRFCTFAKSPYAPGSYFFNGLTLVHLN